MGGSPTYLRLISGLLAVYLLNCSIDITYRYGPFGLQDRTMNDQESVIELILEKVLNWEDAIPEVADDDLAERSVLKKDKKVDPATERFTFKHLHPTSKSSNPTGVGYADWITPIREVPSPPPNI